MENDPMRANLNLVHIVIQRSPVMLSVFACILLTSASVRAATIMSEKLKEEFEVAPAAEKTKKFEAVLQERDLALVQQGASDEQAKSAKEDAKVAHQEVAKDDSAKLLRSGVTVGFAVALQFPAFATHNTAQANVESTGMPYVVFLPHYWGASEATREYCASNWGSGDEDEAQTAAAAIAHKRALRLFDNIVAAIHSVGSPNKIAIAAHFVNEYSNGHGIVQGIIDWDATSEPAATHEQRKADLIQWLADQDWNPSQRGSCGWKKVGFWVGRPLNYSAKVRMGENEFANRNMVPKFAFGLTFTPNAYVSVLLGVTVGNAELVQGDGQTIESKTCWAGTFALGGNLDLAGTIFKIAQKVP
jgi:hypothetical protein